MKSKNPLISWRKKIFQKKYIFLWGIFVVFFFGLSFLWAACDVDIICYFDQKIEGTSGTAHTWWSFDPAGNAGIVNFNVWDVVLTRDQTTGLQYLSGRLWSQTVGWMYFNPSIGALTTLDITSDDSKNIRIQNTLSGWLWSENAGWIQMNPNIPGGWVTFNTTNGPALNGWAYSSNLGWIELGNWLVASTLGDGLIGKVKVIGNLSGNNIFDVLYNVGSSFAGQNTANTLNKIKKNIALSNRWMTINSTLDRKPQNGILYYKQSWILTYSSDINLSSGSKYFIKEARTLIIEWADLLIDECIGLPTSPSDIKWPKAIIVLTDKDGNGGNIIIKWNVTKIYSTLIAEKSILSGVNQSILYNETKENVLSALPPYQLYIKGSVVSYNTIWWSSNNASDFRCPYFETTNCNGTTSLKYDFNYFRNFQSGSTSVSTERAISWYDIYSMIIEFDPKALSDPPPGLSF